MLTQEATTQSPDRVLTVMDQNGQRGRPAYRGDQVHPRRGMHSCTVTEKPLCNPSTRLLKRLLFCQTCRRPRRCGSMFNRRIHRSVTELGTSYIIFTCT